MFAPRFFSLRFATLIVALFCASASVLSAAEPVVRAINLRGLQVGATTNIILDGDDLVGARLLLPFPSKQELKPGSTDKRAVLEVALDLNVQSGYYQTWVVSESGVSQPIILGVDPLPQKPFAPLADRLPIAMHGVLNGATVLETSFVGKAKQKVMIEVESHRIGGKLRPIIHLNTPKKLQLAWSWATPTLFGDARLEAVLPEDGTYTVTMHDAEYAGPAPPFFRLKIGEWSFADQVFPPAVTRGKSQKVELLGMMTPATIDVTAGKESHWLPLPEPKGAFWSGPRPFVGISNHPEFIQQITPGKLQDLPLGPIGVSGKIMAPFEEDRYRLAVAPGKKIKLEVFAERIGSPLDAALIVRNEKGDQLVRAEDGPGTLDPVLEYVVPDKVNAIIVGVVDAQGRAGTRCIYRLVIHPQATPADAEDFALSTPLQRLALPVGGKIVMPIFVDRKGTKGKIDLSAKLPAAVKMEGGLIPDGCDGTLLTLERTAAPFDAAIAQWTGRSVTGDEQPLVTKGNPLERVQPWLATEIALAPSKDKAADFVVEWRDLPADIGWVPGNKLVLPVKAARGKDKTTIRLTALTSQITPLVNNQPDPNKALRQEKPIEVPINLNVGDVTMIVPPELTGPVYDVTVQAELLDPAKKVLATSFTPVRRLAVRLPLFVKLAGPERIETMLDPKKGPTTVKIAGKVERKEGLKGDVVVALAGLPAGIAAPPVTVKADALDFAVNVVLPPTIAAGEIKGLKLSASAGVDAKQPNLRVRSRDVDVTIVVAIAKEAPVPPKK